MKILPTIQSVFKEAKEITQALLHVGQSNGKQTTSLDKANKQITESYKKTDPLKGQENFGPAITQRSALVLSRDTQSVLVNKTPVELKDLLYKAYKLPDTTSDKKAWDNVYDKILGVLDLKPTAALNPADTQTLELALRHCYPHFVAKGCMPPTLFDASNGALPDHVSLSKVMFSVAHNATMSGVEDGYWYTQQDQSLDDLWASGVRGFKVPLHWRTEEGKTPYMAVAHDSSPHNNCTVAQRTRYNPFASPPQVDDFFRRVSKLLDQDPKEVAVLHLDDFLNSVPKDPQLIDWIETQFSDPTYLSYIEEKYDIPPFSSPEDKLRQRMQVLGLEALEASLKNSSLWEKTCALDTNEYNHKPWPPLGELRQSGQRVVVFLSSNLKVKPRSLEPDTGQLPRGLSRAALYGETDFSFKESQLTPMTSDIEQANKSYDKTRQGSSRGDTKSFGFVLNHFSRMSLSQESSLAGKLYSMLPSGCKNVLYTVAEKIKVTNNETLADFLPVSHESINDYYNIAYHINYTNAMLKEASAPGEEHIVNMVLTDFSEKGAHGGLARYIAEYHEKLKS